MSADSPSAAIFAQADALIQKWLYLPSGRDELDEAMVALARDHVGDSPPDLLDVWV